VHDGPHNRKAQRRQRQPHQPAYLPAPLDHLSSLIIAFRVCRSAGSHGVLQLIPREMRDALDTKKG